MKNFCLLVYLSLILSANARSQSVAQQLPFRWDSLNRQLQISAALTVSYISYVSESKAINRNDVRQVNEDFVRLLRHLDTKVPVDSLFILKAYRLNFALTVAIGRTLTSLENDAEFRRNRNTEFLMQKVTISNQTLSAEIDSYNYYVNQVGLLSLTFGKARKS
jgi:hypothetical protein